MKQVLSKHHGLTMLFALVITVVFTTTQATAQMGNGPGQGGSRSMRGPMYNVSTETTVKGTVEEVQQLTGKPSGVPAGNMWGNCPREWAGTHINLTTDQGPLIVHVGPSAYLANNNFTIARGDQLSITGSKVQYQGSDFLIAREITKGDQVVTLRDAKGFPLWSGQRRGSPMPGPPAGN